MPAGEAGSSPLTLTEAALRLRDGTLRAADLVETLLVRIEALDPRLHVVLHLDAEGVRRAAHEADRARADGRLLGRLHGVPVGVKDIFDVAGQPTTAQSRILAGNIAAEDAVAVARLRDAGAIPFGKLATHEFAIGGPSHDLPSPPVRNPWNLERFTGGSSSGSAAGVAAGLFPGALGSDTGGSIRVPAALSGIAGIKPSWGMISRRGVVPLAWSLDTVGPMAWTAEDCAHLLAAMAEPSTPDPRAELERGLVGLRIGYARHLEDELAVEPSMRACLDDTVARLRSLGASVEEVRLPTLAATSAALRVILVAEAYAIHEATLATRTAEYGQMFRLRVLPGATLSAADYLAAQRERASLAAAIDAAVAPFDAVLTAIATGPAPTLAAQAVDRNFARPFLASTANVSGGPAVALCAGFTSEGLPLGVQFIGAAWRDGAVLRVANALERDLGLRGRRPLLG